MGVEDGIGLKELRGPTLVFLTVFVPECVQSLWRGGHCRGGQQVGGPLMKLVLWSLSYAPVLFPVPVDSVYFRPHGTCFELA